MKKLEQLDNWRAILSCIVFISHGFQILSPSDLKNQEWMRIWGPLAHISVLLFFFISGFVIWNSLLYRSNWESNSFKFTLNFAKARFFRIFPPLIGSIVVIYIIKILMKIYFHNHSIEEFNFSRLDVFQYLTMTKVSLGKINAPLWSLIIEWWFYFLGLLIFKYSIKKNVLFKIIILIICYYILKNVLIFLNTDILIYFLIWTIGALVNKYNLFENKKINIIITILLSYYLFIDQNILFSGIDLSKSPMFQLLIIIAFIGIIGIEFNVSILKYLSKFSYSLYIIHYPIFLFVFYFFNLKYSNTIIVLSITFILTMFFAFIFSFLFERNWSKISTIIIKKWGVFRN